MDVLYLTINDWCNTGYRYCECLKLLGLDVVGLKADNYNITYPQGLEVDGRIQSDAMKGNLPIMANAKGLRELAEQATVIHFGSSSFVDTGVDLSKKFVVVNHGGRTYRKNPESSNEVFNWLVDKTLIQCPDLLGHGAKEEELIFYPVDTDFIKPDFSAKGERLVIGHFPSSIEAKGTKTILAAIEILRNDPAYKDRFDYIGWTDTREKRSVFLSWEEQLEQYKRCDVYIESCQLQYNGKHFGAWGNTSLEAGASGCVVVTNDIYPTLYRKEYGDCALNVANDRDQIVERLKRLIDMKPVELLIEKKKVRNWVVAKHGMKPTAERLKDKIYSNFFDWS